MNELLLITKANFSALMLDRGRIQQQSLGLTQSGPMDEYAFLWANKLLGNDLNAACIEITFGKFSVKALQRCQLAITGANFNSRLNQDDLTNWGTISLLQGDELVFDGPKMNGTRAYLAIKGGFDCPRPFHSACTVQRENLGGFSSGKALQVGEKLSSLTEQIQTQIVNVSVYPELIIIK
jgi:allophanate hydrolase subunit 2